jgi:protoporphyrinogen oxidase
MSTDALPHTLILGAGPGGLAAALQLVTHGVAPVVIEKDAEVGGLMRAVRRGPFVVDIGRKELYSRIPAVDRVWSDLLGDDYRRYQRRVGILFEGCVFDASPRALWAGMPRTLLAAGVLDYAAYRVLNFHRSAHNYQEHWYRHRGPRLTRMTTQGFAEKFTGRRWAELPPPTKANDAHGEASIRGRLRRGPSAQAASRHPARGTGQLCEMIEKRVRDGGGRIHLNTRVVNVVTAGERISSVTVESEAVGRVTYEPAHVVSSIPVQALARSFAPGAGDAAVASLPRARASTVLVYLFSDEPPRTPYCWIEVTCPETQAGRITNYAAFNGSMVPAGMTCLCVEYFHAEVTGLLASTDDELFQLALRECAAAGLFSPDQCTDHLVLRLPGVDAATQWERWREEGPMEARRAVSGLANLLDVNRPGTDRAFHAGLAAGEAIISGDRAEFDRRTDPGAPVPWEDGE